ncbi:MAG: hypothetical protein MMC33_000352 [Icmadophila ericetorum]|nr:hypothetical protein [Icmadophila ericetorum]
MVVLSLSRSLCHSHLPPAFLTRNLSTTTALQLPQRDRPRRNQIKKLISPSPILPPSERPPPPSGPQILNYYVNRTASRQLPVYHLGKGGGGNQHLTRIRKITGDLNQLKEDLRRALGLREDWIWVNGLTQQVVIKV